MQYLLLIYANEAEMAARDPATMQAMTGEYVEFTKGIVQAGQFKAGDRLKPTSSASTNRSTNSSPIAAPS